MKKSIFIMLMLFSYHCIQAQTFSGWISASNTPTLQVRWATKKDASNYSYLLLEFISSVGCKFNVTASLCDKDAKSVNGWKAIRLIRNKQATYSFKIRNSCTNGFWWWYKDYATTTVKYDDN